MKKLNKYIMLFVAAFALVSCVDDIVDTPSAESKAGEDVQFGLSLPSARTVYGKEANSALPIYWSNNDKVQIYSPECAAGHNDAEYNVTPVNGQSYAEKLTKTGAYGVQWGDKETANFYSVYPSLNAQFSGSGNAVTATLHISNEQKSNASFGKFTDMDNVVMYAQTNDVTAGEKVNLTYTPYSTVLSFTMNIGAMANGSYGSLVVNSLTLTAPEDTAIAGDFTLEFNGTDAPKIAPAGNNTNSITITFATAPTLNADNKSVTINVPVIPLSSTNINGWMVEVNVTEGGSLNEDDTYTKTKTLGNGALTPGKIHKITLPTIVPEAAWTYNLDDWMTSLDKKEKDDYQNIYLTELSIPGAWYAGAPTSDGYQSTASIEDLWNGGVRGFAVECRTITSSRLSSNPVDVVVSGTQDNGWLVKYCFPKDDTKYIRDVIDDIAGAISTKEFGVLVLSYADGGSYGQRTEDHNFFLQGVKKAISDATATNIYTDEITSATTVKSVLGKLIIKVNVDYEIGTSNYDDSMPALISYVPHLNQFTDNQEKPFDDYLSTPLFSKLYWKEWDDSYKKYTTTTTTTTDFLWCASYANRTAPDTATNTEGISNYSQRISVLNGMISHSKEIYANSTHNVWFCFGCGGTQAANATTGTTSATSFASKMNPELLKIIQRKMYGGTNPTTGEIVESDPSPLGIVMFNQCIGDTYSGEKIVRAIIEMNDAFELKRYNPNTEDDDETVTDPFA